MLRTAGSPTADGKADLEGQQKADQRSLLPGLVYPLRKRAQSREQRARRSDWKYSSTARRFPLQSAPQKIDQSSFIFIGSSASPNRRLRPPIGGSGVPLSHRPRRPFRGIFRGLALRLRVDDGAEQHHERRPVLPGEHDELRDFLRSRSRHNQYIPDRAHRRRHFLHHARIAIGVMQIA